jgi:hypothetical protein
MKEPRHRHVGLSVFDNVFVMGGIGKGGEWLDSIEVYDEVRGEWETIGKLEEKLADFVAVAINHKSIVLEMNFFRHLLLGWGF